MPHRQRQESQGVINKTDTKYEPLKIDGILGPKTIMLTQQLLGTKQDGYISNQPMHIKFNIDMSATTPCAWQFVYLRHKYRGGSPMVTMLQKLVGANADGYFNKSTINAMQAFLHGKGFSCGPVNGYLGPRTVEAWQRYLNYKYGKEEVE